VSPAYRRLITLPFTYLAVVATAFLIVDLQPGDPARLILGTRATPAALDSFRNAHGYDRPFLERFARFSWNALQLDLGDSLVQRRPVRTIIFERLSNSARIILTALLLVLFASVLPCLLLSNPRFRFPRLVFGHFLSAVSATPPYVVAIILLLSGGVIAGDVLFFDNIRPTTWILPSLALAAYPAGLLFQLLAQELERTSFSLYALRARAFGFRYRHILFREILRNAAIPAVASLANSVAYFLTGSVFVEAVFGVPGIGLFTYDSIRNKDVPALLGCVVIFAALVCLLSTVFEFCLWLLDPSRRIDADA